MADTRVVLDSEEYPDTEVQKDRVLTLEEWHPVMHTKITCFHHFDLENALEK